MEEEDVRINRRSGRFPDDVRIFRGRTYRRRVEVDLGDISIHRHVTVDGVLCLAVAGELDVATSGRLDAAISESADAGDLTHLVVDLDQVTFLDSTGIQTLLDGRDSATERGLAFRVMNPHGVVRRALEITGVLALLTDGSSG
jgi:anti-anti-sigma factor